MVLSLLKPVIDRLKKQSLQKVQEEVASEGRIVWLHPGAKALASSWSRGFFNGSAR